MLKFLAGERQYVTAKVEAEELNEIAVVNSASYELFNCKDETLVDNGNCEIEGDELKILLDCIEPGTYKLIATAHVGIEIIKGNAIVKVGV